MWHQQALSVVLCADVEDVEIVLHSGGAVECWGGDNFGEIGNDAGGVAVTSVPAPTPV